MIHVTKEFHRVRPKQFSSLWYVRHKPCTYLASRLALSPNGPNEFPLKPSYLGVPSSASMTISNPKLLWCKPCTYLSPTLTLSPNGPKWDSTTYEFHRVHLKRFLSLGYIRCKLCTYLASRLALSPNGPKWASTWASSSRNSIGCIQNNWFAYGTFSATGAPILHLY
jgi:hypothetical protein